MAYTFGPALESDNGASGGQYFQIARVKSVVLGQNTPFGKKDRVLNYSTETNGSDNIKKSQKTMISSLSDTTNRNTDNNKWNSEDGVSAGAYISKIKLN